MQTLEAKLHFIKKMCLYYVIIHTKFQDNFHQNWIINECARKKKAVFPQLRKEGVFCEV